jgi:(1->4)-alpha-D-glucan 1-alpha-D-glucosylmutase
VQLRPSFDFDAVAALADYLSALGASHLYASPYLQAVPGSAHGYDVVDPTRVNEELGGESGHGRLQRALEGAGLGQVLDIVPNHMAISGPENRWWWDVLRHGPAGEYAPFFDVDWDPPESKLRNQVLLPILGDHYGRVLEAGEIRLAYDDGVFTVRYHDHLFPVAPRALGDVVLRAAGIAGASAVATELGFLGRSLKGLPEPGHSDEAARARRRSDVEAIDGRLRELIEGAEGAREALDTAIAEVNADPDALDALASGQNYRLAHWRTAGQELDYRRFFDIDTLAGLRTEDGRVFDAVHGRVLDWIRAGVLDGIRVDHPDGLRRPGEYFTRLREAAPGAWIVAEKILMPDEPLPDWPVEGTTGYDLLNDVTAVLNDPRGEAPLTRLWVELTGDARSFEEVAREARYHVLRDVLGSDVNRLANIFVELCESRRRYRDYTRRELRQALIDVAACFPVYRTYVGEDGPAAERAPASRPRDREVIEAAVAGAGEVGDADAELLGFLKAILVGEVQEAEARGLRMRFQQLTGPAAAKGEEDTAFYRYTRFVALNEVGGDPGRWALAPATFHERMARRAREHPATMNALSTHDTKRSEDVRARLLVLSELPDRWAGAVTTWRRRNAVHWPDAVPPDPAAELLLYQTLVGAWPLSRERAVAYMEKASREAKSRTSWTEPDHVYDEALRTFIANLYDSGFEREVASFVEPLIAPGRVVSLAQKLVQLTVPGVPDVYQGSEVWDLSLVDPDNRRPVDFEARRTLLEELGDSPDPAWILAAMDRGAPKLWTVRQALRVRARRPSAFEGGYTVLDVAGEASDHALGFLRGEAVAVLVPRLPVRLVREGGWRGTEVTLPDGRWRDVLTGEVCTGGAVRVAEVLGRFPVALLEREDV